MEPERKFCAILGLKIRMRSKQRAVTQRKTGMKKTITPKKGFKRSNGLVAPPSVTPIHLDWPVWYDPLAPHGSAVRHIAALSAKIHWVHLDIIDGGKLRSGPRIGDPSLTLFPESVKQFILARKNMKMGQLRVGCTHLQPDDELLIQKVITEWLALWPTPLRLGKKKV